MIEPMTSVPVAGIVGAVSVADRVRKAVEISGLSMRNLSLKAGLSDKYVQKLIERGSTRPDGAALSAIANVAGVSAAWLITGHGSPDEVNDADGRADSQRLDPDTDRLMELSSLPNWPALLEAAKARANDKNRHLPDWVWDAVGGASLRIVGTPEPVGVYELAVVHFENGWGRPREDGAKPAKS